MPLKLIIDADPGVDDALAVLTALSDPSLDVVALTATAGAVSGTHATRNLQFLTDLTDPPRFPRIGGSLLPKLLPSAAGRALTRHDLNGPCGMGECRIEMPDLHNRRESARLIVDLAREFPGEIRVLCLGPLTNIAAAAEIEPQLSHLLAGVVALGGSLAAAGDVSSCAEFNLLAAPEAAAAAVRTAGHILFVPLEVSRTPMLTFEDIDVLSALIGETENGIWIRDRLQDSVRAARSHMGSEVLELHSVAALAVVARAEAFSQEAASVDIETEGRLTRGMMVFDRRSGHTDSTVDVVTTIDAPAVTDYFVRGIRRVCL